MHRPAVLLFDVNETLLDIEALRPLFQDIFDDGRVLRDWYAQLVIYSQAGALTDRYVPFGTLAGGVLRMLGTIYGKAVTDAHVAQLAETSASLPAHTGVPDALERLRKAGFRLATLTNSPPSAPPTPLEKAGLASFLEKSMSVEAVQRFKPAPECYRHAVETLDVAPQEICMVATHIWDLLGAQAIGCHTAFVSWGDNALLPLPELPQPDVSAATMVDLADAIISRWPKT